MSIRIVLADDHKIVRAGLAALLQREPDFELVGEAEDGMSAVRLARQLRPNVLVTDLAMPGMNGIEAIRRIAAESPEVRGICLSVHNDNRMVLAVLDAGAMGYVMKDCSLDELVQAIRKVMSNQVYLSPELVGIVVEKYRSRNQVVATDAFSLLTARERELVQLFSEGFSTQNIADRLSVSTKTVATHRQHILQKLGIGGIAELTRYALREGLSTLDGQGAPQSAARRQA
ncbi:MAG: response regulator transcription factor [Betaproteobacteria bacterium]|nr:response regulator transcription factor [Betaproteobacteria bacterium]